LRGWRAGGHDVCEQPIQHAALLQVAQTGRVRGGDVHGEITHHRREPLDQTNVVIDAVRAVLVGTDVEANDTAVIGARRKSAQHRFRTLVEEASDGIFLADNTGLISYASPSLRRTLGFDPDELMGTSGFALVHPEDVPAAQEYFGRVLAHPRSFRFTSMVHQLDNVAWRAVPIILLITFLIGAIIAQQGIFHFRKFGAENYVVDMVGILVLREIGVLIVAIMIAGRSGSAFTAELGAMKMREEVDALRTMGFDPIEVLVLPRIMALIIGLPILTFIGSMSALYGGGLVAWLYGGIDPDVFLQRLKEAITLDHFKVGMIKAPCMALVIGIVACVSGFEVKGSSESLGLQTTESVVESIFCVIVLDAIFSIVFLIGVLTLASTR